MANVIPEILHIDSFKLKELFLKNEIAIEINNDLIISLLHESYTYKIVQKGKRKNNIKVYKKTKPPKKYIYRENKKIENIDEDSGYESYDKKININSFQNDNMENSNSDDSYIELRKINQTNTSITSKKADNFDKIRTDVKLQNSITISSSYKNKIHQPEPNEIMKKTCKNCILNKFRNIIYKVMKTNIYIKNKLLLYLIKNRKIYIKNIEKWKSQKDRIIKDVYLRLNKYRSSAPIIIINRDVYNEILDLIVDNDLLILDD